MPSKLTNILNLQMEILWSWCLNCWTWWFPTSRKVGDEDEATTTNQQDTTDGSVDKRWSGWTDRPHWTPSTGDGGVACGGGSNDNEYITNWRYDYPRISVGSTKGLPRQFSLSLSLPNEPLSIDLSIVPSVNHNHDQTHRHASNNHNIQSQP